MKYKIIVSIFFIFVSLYFYSQNIKDTFSIVLIKDNDNALMYKSADINSEVIAKIPSTAKNLRTTWRTINTDLNSWIEIIFENKKGWLKREDLTRAYGIYDNKSKEKVIDLLINLTKALQQKDSEIFRGLFYSLRGVAIYNIRNKRLDIYKYVDINELWKKMPGKNNESLDNIAVKTFDYVLKILESDFDINYNIILKDEIKIPLEIINFEYIMLKCNFDNRLSDLSLYIGIEFWNNKPFISSIILDQ